VVAVCIVASLTGCSSSSTTGQTTQLTIFAASSLSPAFTQIANDFQSGNPGVHVDFNFGPSDHLAAQIESEGTADVFASASSTWMDDVAKKVGVIYRADLARNKLVIITPSDNPANVQSLDDLARPDVKVVLAAQGVPVGDYARQAVDRAGISRQVLANLVSSEQDDASTVAKITAGEADAAIVYASDVTGPIGHTVRTIRIPDSENVVATYSIAIVRDSSHEALAHSFVLYATSTGGQATLARLGFEAPR